MAADALHGMKDTPAGPMPCDWELRRLGEFAREVAVRARANGTNDLPLLSVTKHHGIVRAEQYFGRSPVVRDTSNCKVVRKGQFAYATIHLEEGSIGRHEQDAPGLVSPMYTVFEVDSGLDPAFLLELLKSPRYLQRYDAFSRGSVNRRASIPFESLRTLTIHFPSIEEQRRIAETLEAVARLITSTAVVLAQLKSAKHAVMRELLTIGHHDYRTKLVPLPGLWRTGRVAPDIERMPKHWKLVTLTEVARLESGHTPSRNHPEYWEGDIPWISLQDTEGLKQLVISETVETTGPLGIKNSSARLLPKDTVVFSRTASVGLASRMGREMATSQDFANWVCGAQLNPRYLVQVFRHMDREWRRLQAGSTHQTVYMPVFKKLKILLPPRDEQEAIADVGDACDLRVVAEQSYLKQLQETKRGLAQALLSGRVRVPNGAAKRGAMARASRRG